ADVVDRLLHPAFDKTAKKDLVCKGLPASPGAATGRIVFDADDAEDWTARKEKVVLVRDETSPEDIGGMHVAQGILTSHGGMTCIAGETRVLTNEGLLSARETFERVERDARLRILSFDARAMRPVWRRIVAAGRRSADVISVSVSQTGRVD